MVKLVDALDSKSSGEIRAGSSPARGTKLQRRERACRAPTGAISAGDQNGDLQVAVFVCRPTAWLRHEVSFFLPHFKQARRLRRRLSPQARPVITGKGDAPTAH